MSIWIWTAVIAVSLVIEMATTEMVCVWFACSGLIALISSAIGLSFTWQVIIFVLLSILLMLIFKKVTKRFIKGDKVATNADMLTGLSAYLEKSIIQGRGGMLKVNGIAWTCKSNDGKGIRSGEKVEIIKIKGNTLIVRKERI